jgi:hypothetical protein
MIEAKNPMHIIYIGIQEGEEGTLCVNRVDDKKLWETFFRCRVNQ